MIISPELKNVFKKYKDHPDFLGVQIVDPNQRGAVDDTVLHIAIRKGALNDIKILVSHGADINLAGDLGYTPLHMAALTNQVSSVQLLLSLGANPTILNEFSQTLLQVAQSVKHDKVIEVLSKVKYMI